MPDVSSSDIQGGLPDVPSSNVPDSGITVTDLESDEIPNLRHPISEEASTISALSEDDLSETDPDTVVRVSIVLEDLSTIEKGYSTKDIAENADAAKYRESLQEEQEEVRKQIEERILGGEDLDVVWNLTLAANIISTNVRYGDIEEIQEIPGVKDVVLETKYAPAVVDENLPVNPTMATSSDMIGTTQAWGSGYTGAGTKIAIVDTGIDLEHQSFEENAFLYSLQEQGLNAEELLTGQQEIESLLQSKKLNVTQRVPEISSSELYKNKKVPFGFNYADSNTNVSHKEDTQGEHGSHVAGIAAANSYIADSASASGYANALDKVFVQGVAPDAQLFAMKVFGKVGGYDSDYMAAIEDAIMLGANVVNLSLGSVYPGFAHCDLYDNVLEEVAQSDTVLVISAGNSGQWAEKSNNGSLQADDVNFDTVGSPGSYDNALTVASVENDGFTAKYMKVTDAQGVDHLIYYHENLVNGQGEPYGNDSIETLAGEREFVFLDSIGKKEEFAAVKDKLNGKIAVCRRGDIPFWEKAQNAVENGAQAVIIVNTGNETNAGMDLSDYTDHAPVVMVTLDGGQTIWDAATETQKTEVTYDDGGTREISFALGNIYISSEIGNVTYGSDYYRMSTFSSWGVPGTLTLKPEITAPGGNIYSVNGFHNNGDQAGSGGTDQYENMSGTSMAAPQVSGMMAVLMQYIQKTGLDKKAGKSPRVLAQSLLMSTASPLVEEGVGMYSVLNQGAGLANIGLATQAKAYILMDSGSTNSAADGKVKVELGEMGNSFQFVFSLNSLSEDNEEYILSTSLFTQLIDQENGILLDDTTPLAANVTYTVNGQPFTPTAQTVDADVDQDGDTDAFDAQAILDFLVGGRSAEELDRAAMDVDKDGRETSYDAHLILAGLGARFTLEAGQSVTIGVSGTLTGNLSAYKNGAYVEGFTTVTAVASEEGLLDVSHSIPILGFAGNWTDPSMYERASILDKYYENPDAVPYVDRDASADEISDESYSTNYMEYRKDGKNYIYYGNPYVAEEEYPSGKAALNSSDMIFRYVYTLIRGGETVGIVKDGSGNILYVGEPVEDALAAYYYTNGGEWENAAAKYSIKFTPAEHGMREGDTVTVQMVTVPEYYGNHLTKEQMQSLIESGRLGKGAFLSSTFILDDTPPKIQNVEEKKDLLEGSDGQTKDLVVTLSDNAHVAYVAVTNRSGQQLYYGEVPENTPGEEFSVTIPGEDLGSVGKNCVILVGDYAGNEDAVMVEYNETVPDSSGYLFVHTDTFYDDKDEELQDLNDAWVKVDPDEVTLDVVNGHKNYKGMEVVAYTPANQHITAAEFIDGYVFYVVGSSLYSADLQDMGYGSMVADLAESGLTQVEDMAYSYKDNTLYAVDGTTDEEGKNKLWTIDPVSGEATVVAEITVQGDNIKEGKNDKIIALAVNDEGDFYAVTTYNANNTSPAHLFHWTLEELRPRGDLPTASLTLNPTGALKDSSKSYNSDLKAFHATLAWDHNEDKLYLAITDTPRRNDSGYFSKANDNRLFIVHTDTASCDLANKKGRMSNQHATLNFASAGLFSVPLDSAYGYDPTEEVTEVSIQEDDFELMVTGRKQLSASVMPWTLSEQGVLWSSEDTNVASVDEQGLVTAIGVGQTTIKATAVKDTGKSASVQVTVKPIAPEAIINGLVYTGEEKPYWSEINVAKPSEFKASQQGEPFRAGTMDYDEQYLYVQDGRGIYKVDMQTKESTLLYNINSQYLFPDAATTYYLSQSSTLGKGSKMIIAPIANSRTLMLMVIEEAKLFRIDLSSVLDSNIAAIAFAGIGTKTQKRDYYYLLLENGKIYSIYLNDKGSASYAFIGNTGLDLTGMSSADGDSYVSMIYDFNNRDTKTGDGHLYVSFHVDGEEESYLSIIDLNEKTTIMDLKTRVSFGAGKGSAVSLYQTTKKAEADPKALEEVLTREVPEEIYVSGISVDLTQPESLMEEGTESLEESLQTDESTEQTEETPQTEFPSLSGPDTPATEEMSEETPSEESSEQTEETPQTDESTEQTQTQEQTPSTEEGADETLPSEEQGSQAEENGTEQGSQAEEGGREQDETPPDGEETTSPADTQAQTPSTEERTDETLPSEEQDSQAKEDGTEQDSQPEEGGREQEYPDRAARGSLLAITTNSIEQAETGSDSNGVQFNPAAKTVTVRIFGEKTTNGRFRVDYDSQMLHLKDVYGLANYYAYDSAKPGTVQFVYADALVLSQALTELVFSYDKESGWATQLKLTVQEDGEKIDENSETIIPVSLPEEEENATNPSVPPELSPEEELPTVPGPGEVIPMESGSPKDRKDVPDSSEPTVEEEPANPSDSTVPSEPPAGEVSVSLEQTTGEGIPFVSVDPATFEKLKSDPYIYDEEARAALDAGLEVDVYLDVQLLDPQSKLYQEGESLAKQKAEEEGYEEGVFLEIHLLRYINHEFNKEITEIATPLKITIGIPEEVLAKAGSDKEFAVIRLHEKVADVLPDLDDDLDTITFETDKFSLYEIVYRDASAGSSHFGWMLPVWIILAGVLIIGLLWILLILWRKKKKDDDQEISA